MTPADILARVGAIADRAMAQPIRTPLHDLPLSQVARALLGASAVELSEPVTREEWIATGPRIHVFCPASTIFDAAEALRLELVAAAPPGVTVDVEIARGGGGSAEDEEGRRLFAEVRRGRLDNAGHVPTTPDDA